MKQTIIEAAEAVQKAERDPLTTLALFRDIEDALRTAIEMVQADAMLELEKYPNNEVILGEHKYKIREATRWEFPKYEPLMDLEAEIKRIKNMMKMSDLNTYDGEGNQIPMAIKRSKTTIFRLNKNSKL